jgi:hypothetical protein
VSRWLAQAPQGAFVAYAIVAAFGTYFCMYAFRKPFAAASFDGVRFLDTDVDLKTALVIGQILGYTASKYLGIRWCAEVSRRGRPWLLAGLVFGAEVALGVFALVPGEARVLAIGVNGLCLGMIWGLVVRYLEGRRTSELLLAGLSVSFIVASGLVKDVGRWLMDAYGVAEAAMPVATGALFLLPFLGFVWLLDRLPEPDPEDVAARVARTPMSGPERRAFLRRFLPALIGLFGVYFFLTAYRDYRDNYGVELFAELGYADAPAIFTRTELPVAFGVLLALAALNLVQDNRRGLIGAVGLMIAGALLMVGGTVLLQVGVLDGVGWMIAIGLGSYLIYVPYGSVLFDRLVATTGVAATAVFTIMVADALGYTGSIAVQLGKDLLATEQTRLEFFVGYTYAVGLGGAALLAGSLGWLLQTIRPPE